MSIKGCRFRKVCSTRSHEPRSFICEIQLRHSETHDGVFVGGFTGRVTPVPIPNTVVKPAGPMILLQRESRSLPALIRTPVPKGSGFFFARSPLGKCVEACSPPNATKPRQSNTTRLLDCSGPT